MMTRWRERRPRERPRGDPILLEERAVQRPLDDQRPLCRFGELYDAIRIWGFRRGKGQRASKADEVVRVLRDVMLEARLAQRAGRELRVEGHRADGLVDGGVSIPGLAREEFRAAPGRGCSWNQTTNSTTYRKHGGPGRTRTSNQTVMSAPM